MSRHELNALDEQMLGMVEGGGMPPIQDYDKYNFGEAKLISSVKWLITRVYARDVPDKLRNIFYYTNEGARCLDTSVCTAMTNGSLYAQAAAKIFKQPHLVQLSHGAVLACLAEEGVPAVFRPEEGGQPVSEQQLFSAHPFHATAHIAILEALMNAHLRSVISIERTVEAVSAHTSVDERERPLDAADALLFWINKICLLVRDDVERSGFTCDDGSEMLIPEMEDLYEDLGDGAALCALVAFYRPGQMNMTSIRFNEQPSMADCQYNLTLLKSFCEQCLEWNPFHFAIEDLLYMHECLQVNVDVFLADLFTMFEPLAESPSSHPAQSGFAVQSPRRFVPIAAIPHLRAANQAARPHHPPRVQRLAAGGGQGRSMSVMSSDSLFSNRTVDSLNSVLPPQRGPGFGANVTNFGALQQQHSDGGCVPGSPYTRSDSLPAASIRLALEEKRREHERRMALESTATESERAEKQKAAFFALMKQHEQQPPVPDQQTALLEKLGEKVQTLSAQVERMNLEVEQTRLARATSQPSVYHDLNVSARSQSGYGTLPHGASPSHYAQPQPYGQAPHMSSVDMYQQQAQFPQHGHQMYGGQHGYEQHMMPPMRSSLSNGMLNYLPPAQTPQPMQPYGMEQPVHPAPQQFGMQMHPMSMSSYEGYGGGQMGGGGGFMQGQQPQMGGMMHQSMTDAYGGMGMQQPHQPMVGVQQMQPMFDQQQMPMDGTATFRLHNNTSRAEPQLEMNRNLTNWGMQQQGGGQAQAGAFQQGMMQQMDGSGDGQMMHQTTPPVQGSQPLQQQQNTQRSRRTWENQTFIKSQKDLVNQPDMVPTAPNEQEQPSRPVSQMIYEQRRSKEDTPAPENDVMHAAPPQQSRVMQQQQQQPQCSPPRDPSGHGVVDVVDGQGTAPPGPAFVVSDDQAANDFDMIAEQKRAAKREALLAKTMKRKEEMENKSDEKEAKFAALREAEERKQAEAEQRKREKEEHRQRVLDDYKRRKAEKDQAEAGGGSARGRGNSQPPFIRTKSQMTDSEGSWSARGRMTPRTRGMSNVEEPQRIFVASIQEPTLKLFSKTAPKSNRSLIINALQYSVFPGAVSADARNKVLGELAKSDSKHFLLLFRDQKLQYRGLYCWDQVSDTAIKVAGQGPKNVKELEMKLMFKYSTNGKTFNTIPTKHLSATIDGFALPDQFWIKPKIPHSGSLHRDN